MSRYRFVRASWLVVLAVPSLCVGMPLPLADDSPRIAGPTEFRVELVAESSAEFSWSDALLDGSKSIRYHVYDHDRVVATVDTPRWRFDGIDRDAMYYFSVSAVTAEGIETRRSLPVHIDLPPAVGDSDGGNRQLPPVPNVHAEIIDGTTAEIRWDPAARFWSPTENADYRYSLWIEHTRIAETSKTRWRLHDLDPERPTWVAVTASSPARYSSGNSVLVLVDTGEPRGTRIDGYPGFAPVEDVRAEVYSTTAAELFWDGGSAGPVYNIFADGLLVARVGDDARSYFFDDLIPGKRSRLSIGSGWPHRDNGRDGLLRHVWIETPSLAGDDSNQPNAVTGLRVAVYGPAAAELFWDRASSGIVAYRILIDDDPVAVTEGTSHFLDGLPSGTELSASVTGIGSDERETEPVEVRFATPSAWVQPGPPVCTVSNLRVAVYSTTAAEVFWDRDPAEPFYAISLDGEAATRTQATSWFSNRFTVGNDHAFAIRVDEPGCSEEAATIDFRLRER